MDPVRIGAERDGRARSATGGFAIVALFALLLCLREPQAVLQGRFWAEEGTIFYPYAGSVPFWSALWHSYGGYLNLVANGAALLARHLAPLEEAPRATMLVGLACQCCPAILLAFSRDPVFRPPAIRLAALLLLATPPVVVEVWLQSLHSQFHLALSCALILATEIPVGGLFLFGAALLLLAPLCGPGAIALLPLFGLRALLERSRGRWVQTALLGCGSALQLLVFYHHQAGRAYGIGPVVLLCVVYVKQLVVPFAGPAVAARASDSVLATLRSGHVPVLPVLLTLGATAACLAVAARRRSATATWLLAATALVTWVGYYGAFQGRAGLIVVDTGTRYAFMPQVLAALFALAVATSDAYPDRWIARIAVVWLIAVGLGGMAHIPGLGRDPAWMTRGPDWRAEVAKWRADGRHRIEVWPSGFFLGVPHA